MRELARNGWLSDQHGAWTMMAFPPLLGWALSFTFSWLVVLMLLAWAMAFLMFSAVCLWVKTPAKRRSHIVPAIITYGVLAAVPGITLLAMRPQLLWWAIAFAPLASSAIYLVWQGRERIVPALRALGYDIPDTQSNFYLLRGSVHGLVEASARAGLIVRPFREGVRVSVGSREQNDLFLSVATQFARVEGIGK